MSAEYITVLDAEVAEDLEDGGFVQVVRAGTSAFAAFKAAADAADKIHIKLRVCVRCEDDRPGIKVGGRFYDITTVSEDWSPLQAKFQGIVIISVGRGVAYPAVSRTEINTPNDGAAYCFQISRIICANVFASEAGQELRVKGRKSTMTPWAGAVWCFRPDGTRELVCGTPLPYPPCDNAMERHDRSTRTENQEAAEVLRSIRDAEETGATTLNLSHRTFLTLPREIAQLTSLRELDLSWCEQLQDLSLLAKHVSLQKLNLFGCGRLSDFSPLANLVSLQTLNCRCEQLRDLSPLATLTFLRELNLAGCEQLRDLSPLATLTSLHELNLAACKQLSDLSPLVNLNLLESLDLSWCGLVQDLSPLATLTSLQALDLTKNVSLRRFSPLIPLLSTLKHLVLWGCEFDDLPREVLGERWGQNVLSKVLSHFTDLASGEHLDAEIKVILLGNGGVGKSQLCRRLRGLDYDPAMPSTHGVQLSDKIISLEGFDGPVRFNLWDFGGQEIYHGSHALFLQGQAIFLILWTPKLEQGSDVEGGQTFQRRPLSYWLDYMRAFAGNQSSTLIIQSQCDEPRDRISHPPAATDDLAFFRKAEVSAVTGLGLGLLEETLKEAVRDRLYRRLPRSIGMGRVRVRDQLRQMLMEDQQREPSQRKHQLLEREEFDGLCAEVGGISNPEALLDFLHHTGVIFYRPGLFGDRIVLDQNWALEAIYALFDRKKTLPLLRGYGRFTRADLETLIWSGYTPQEQKVLLGMMESCGICFRVRKLPHQEQLEWSDKECEYIAPELLPEWSEAQKSLLAGRIPKDHPMAEAEARYAFLHEGVLRGYLSKIGQQAGDAAIYWKYGCWSYEETTDSRVLIESQWDDAESETGAGDIRFRAWGENAESLIDPLLEALQKLPVGQPPEIRRTKAIGAHATSRSSASVTVRLVSASHLTQLSDIGRQEQVDPPSQIKLEELIFAPDPFMKDFFVSYTKTDKAWAEWIAWTLEAAGYSTVIQAWDFLPGSNFVLEMQRAATEANRTIAVLSQKYLDSSFTQPEWAAAFAQDPQGKKQKLIPVRVAPCELTGLLAPIVYLDLVGLTESYARTALLGAFSVRNKPASAPAFPGSVPPIPHVSLPQPAYPGTIATSTSTADILVNLVEGADQSRQLSATQRVQFMRQLNEIVPQHFNMLLFAVNPPAGLIPPMPAAQGDRTSALLTWAEAPGGCSLSVLQEVLKTILNPQ